MMIPLKVSSEELKRLCFVCGEQRVPEAGMHKHNYIWPLVYFLSMVKPKNVLEIGSYRGVSTEVLCLLCDKVTVVDPFLDPKIKEEFSLRMKPYLHKLTIIEGLSPSALKDIPTGTFDMCYIDGDHNLQSVLDDIKECSRVVERGGIISGHDYEVVSQVTAGVILGLQGMEPAIVLNDSTWITCNG